ncbi:MFS transporter [Amaricoccus sp.]|uniref:MFS transporter n=1 Tax=Amaricoccus sp. TaxID=1872485 RepID=UPI001B79A3F7|nr:MFS transporter [Amaricoccus sp.]MBP7000464.1 MFS transporter [Amaricoccus sp.]
MTPLARFGAASGLTNLGDGVATVAWAWVASLLTRDPLLISLVAVALRLPWALFALPAGVVADRVDRRRLILAMDIVRAAAFAAAALALWAALPLPPAPDRGLAVPSAFAALVAAAALVGAGEVFRDNAAQTMLPSLVPHDRLERANGRLWSVELVGNALVGPALGAFLVAIAAPAPFAANAAAYAAAALAVASIAGRFRPAAEAPRAWRRELGEGFAFLRAAPLLRTLAWLTGFWNLFFQMVSIALVLHVQENLGMGARAYGLVLAAGAFGGIAGSLAGARVVARLGPGPTAQWMLLASAPAFVAIALAPGPLALALALMAFEFTGLVWNVVSVSYRQRAIPDRLLGRVNSLYRLLAWGMMPVGLLLSGLIVRAAGTVLPHAAALAAPFHVAAAGALILAFAGWRALGRGFAAVRPK